MTKTYRGAAAPALDGVSFSVGEGELVALLGPNGAGKSTLVSILSGRVDPDEGAATLHGERLARSRPDLRATIGVVPQEVRLDFVFTVEEIMRLEMGFYGLRRDDAYIGHLLERLSLADKRRLRTRALSDGMQRRLMIARALVHRRLGAVRHCAGRRRPGRRVRQRDEARMSAGGNAMVAAERYACCAELDALPRQRSGWCELGARLGRVAGAARELGHLTADARAIWHNDPALRDSPMAITEVPLYASLWALAFYRVAHLLHVLGLPLVPRLLSQIARLLTGIEIHPRAVIGAGMFIDHGMGAVIGATAIVGRDVLLYHGVTLGGVDDRPGRRHPLVGDRVMIGAGAKVLGPLRVGDDARIGAQSVVLTDVPPGATAVGIPARVVTQASSRERQAG